MSSILLLHSTWTSARPWEKVGRSAVSSAGGPAVSSLSMAADIGWMGRYMRSRIRLYIADTESIFVQVVRIQSINTDRPTYLLAHFTYKPRPLSNKSWV